ncbi:MAG TPA: DUF1566 domain-containing protein [Spirochaetota bacterium]|nr:DUF1566 domain-containing protein [Spirochaetota bacterium]
MVRIMRTGIMAILAFLVTAGLLAAVRFTDNGDGTVTDHGTGLVWQKCSRGQNILDCSGTATNATWQEALQYCRNLSLDGRSWRLPSVNELKSIVNYSKSGTKINTGYFPNTLSNYWSSSTAVENAVPAWYVHFFNGNVSISNKSSFYLVRCVTDGP